MVFPATGLPATVEIAPGADPAGDTGAWSWVDITSKVRLRDGIQITQGRPDEAGRVDPGTCRLRLDNSTGDFSPRNPLGQWYGSLGRNTPIRVSVRRADDDFTRTESNGWGVEPTWGQTWTVSGGSASDYSVSGGTGRQSLGSVGFLRHSLLDVGVTDARVTADVTCPVVPAGAAISLWVLGRVTDTSNYYVALLTIATSGAVTLGILKRVSGTLTTVASAVSVGTHSAGDTWRVLFDYQGSTLRTKAWKTSGTEPTSWLEGTDTDLTAGTQIGLAAREETGNTNGTQVIRWDNLTVAVDRFSGFVSSWPPRWDKSGNDATVPIEANGVLRRLGQGNPPDRSAMYRTIVAASPAAYWPCGDGAEANWAASALAGHAPLTASGPLEFLTPDQWFQARDSSVGPAAFADLSGGVILAGVLPAAATAATAAAWTVHLVVAGDILATTEQSVIVLEWDTPAGTFVRWQFTWDQSAGTKVTAYNAAGVATDVISLPFIHTGFEVIDVSAVQNGANIDIGFGQELVGGYEHTASVAGTLAGVSAVRVNAGGTTFSPGGFPVGHLAVFGESEPYPIAGVIDAYGREVFGPIFRYLFEAAADRVERLCAEDGVSLTIPPVAADFAIRMGAQPAGTLVDLLYECAEADQGVLYESGFGLGYLPREHRYNRTVAMALDFNLGQVADPPEPTDDDQRLRNRWEVSRSGGSSALAEDTASISAHGPYEGSITVNHFDDSKLAGHAVWRVRLGTVDALRWPRIDLNLAASPELVDQWLACGIGSRVTADNPPFQVAGDDIDVIVEGYSEVLGYKDWYVALNCSPARPWTVATVDGDPRVDTDGATLTSSVASSATSFQVTSTGTVWTTDPFDTPFDINVGGERIRVDAVGTLINANPYFETDITGWTGQAATLSRTTSQRHPDATASLFISPDGVAASGGAAATMSAPGTVTPGGQYIACLWAYTAAGWSDLRPAVDWYDSSGGFLSSGLGTGFSVPAGTWTFLTQTFVAPASASRAVMRARHGGTPGADKTWYAWAIRLMPVVAATSPQPFTVTRSRNGIVKAHAAGTAVNVWTPAVVAL